MSDGKFTRTVRLWATSTGVSAMLCFAVGAADTGTEDQGFLYGRVTLTDGTEVEGRLRFGGAEEAFWDQYFNGVRAANPWARYVPEAQRHRRQPVEILGIGLGEWNQEIDLARPAMVRFGDIEHISASGRELTVRLKGGAVFDLDRFAADDFADGLVVWNHRNEAVALDEWRISRIRFLPTPTLGSAPERLHGAVETAQGVFRGFIQWDREACVGTDQLDGVRFDAIAAIERHSDDRVAVALRDGGHAQLRATGRPGGHRGIYVEDRRFGRVLISWEAFRRIDFSKADSGPGYDDFPPARSLSGQVWARDGRRFEGRLVFDLDESQAIETLDAPQAGVDYTIPLGLIRSITVPPGHDRPVQVDLLGGESLMLERGGDLGEANAGLLIFSGDGRTPDYLPWPDVQRIALDRPGRMFPSPGQR